MTESEKLRIENDKLQKEIEQKLIAINQEINDCIKRMK